MEPDHRAVLEAVYGITAVPREGSVIALAHLIGLTKEDVQLWFEHHSMQLGVDTWPTSEAQEESESDTDMQVYQLLYTLVISREIPRLPAILRAQKGG